MGRVWWGALLVVGAFLVGGSSSAFAEGRKPLEELLFDKGILTKDEAASVQSRKLSSVIDRLTFSGDFRVRQENFWKRNGNDDRSRQRFRLRLGTDLKLDTLTVGIRLASGTGEQVSTNKSFDNLSSQTALYIDRAFLKWQGEESRWLTLTGGRMANPFFTVYSSDIVWDDDYNPEGVAENFTWKLGGSDLFFNAAQIVLDEDSAGRPSTDQWLFGQQVGVKASPLTDVQTVLAVAYYNAVNAQNNNFGQGVCQDGNSRVNACNAATNPGQLVNDYNVVAVTAQVATKVASLPIAVMGDVVQNTADTKSALTGGVDTKAGGYQAGLIVGKASDPATWEAAYFYKKVGTDATLADVADSDFGDGGTNRKGHIGWVAYNPSKALQVKVKYFTTQVEDDTAATQKDVNRLQADLAVKF
jgi:hypothetical protein